MITALRDQLAAVLDAKPARISRNSTVEITDPSSQPSSWITRWIDCSNTNGFGYQLCDNSFGAMYNDGTRLTIFPDEYNISYVDYDGEEMYYNANYYPASIDQKINIARSFSHFMDENLDESGPPVVVNWSSNMMSRTPYMHQWIRTQTSIIMQLSNGTVQINLIDHTKLIMCPVMAAVTYIDKRRNFKTYRFETIQRDGCTEVLAKSLKIAHDKIILLMTNCPNNGIITRSHLMTRL